VKLYLVKCYNEADYPSSGTSFSELVLADSLGAAIEMVRPNVGMIFEDESAELDLESIERMRKPRILS
jgi:hypothetical protein